MTVRQSPHLPRSLATVVLLALAASAAAAPPRATVQADRKAAQVGEPVLVTVRVRGADDTPTVQPPSPDGAKMEATGPPTVVPTFAAELEATGSVHPGGGSHIVNALRGFNQMPGSGGLAPAGLDAKDYVFTYNLTPQRAGSLVVPAFNVKANGQAITTPPLSVNVTAVRAQAWVELRLSLSNPAPIVGEEVLLYVDLLIQRGQVSYGGKSYAYLPVSKVALTLPPLEGVPQLELVEPLGQFVQENAVEAGKHGFRVNNFPTEVKLEHEPADGKGLDPARYRRRLAVPLRLREAGSVTLAAAHAAGEVYDPAGGDKWQPFVTASEPLTFRGLDLRQRADRPADFTGLVGDVRVTAAASQTEMPAGTPFTLTLRLEGNGSVASSSAPDLGARPDFAKGFRVRTEEARTPAGNVREFTYTLRPLSKDVAQVPPVAVSYFDPQANNFGTATSQPIPLKVTPAQNVTPDAPPAPQAAAPVAALTAADEPAAGFRLDSLLPWAEGAMALGVAACAAVWGVRRLRRRRVVRVPREPSPRATPAARRGSNAAAPTFEQLRHTLQDFVRRHFHLPPGEVTPHDAEASLRRGGVPDGLARSFAALLETCETAEFAPGVVAATPAELAAYGRQLMDHVIAAIPEVAV